MKAVQVHAHGGIDELRYEETDDPELKAPTDVIVKLRAAAINRLDIGIRSGEIGTEVFFPRIVGSDGAGTVVAMGSAVTNVKLGDNVCLYPLNDCGRCDFCATDREHRCAERRVLGERENGTYAEYVKKLFFDSVRHVLRGGGGISIGLCNLVAHVDHPS